MDKLRLAHEAIILDACCVINLYASGRMREILSCMEQSVLIADYVYERETLTIRAFDSDVAEPINFQTLIDTGLLAVVFLNSEVEEITFVNFAAEVDDGEAISGAIAFHRGWAIGSDDAVAIDKFHRLTPQQQLVTTPELIKHWADSTAPTRKTIIAALRAVRRRGRYEPGQDHFLYNWWHTLLED